MLLQELYVNSTDQRTYILYAAKVIAEHNNSPAVQNILANTFYYTWNREKKNIFDALNNLKSFDASKIAKQLTIVANEGDELLPKRLATKLQKLYHAS